MPMVFVSYSRHDKTWRERFETMSKPLSRTGGITFWTDQKIGPGEWEPQIENAMQKTSAALLFVSSHFLASDFIMSKEKPYLLKKFRDKKLMIFWLYLDPCDLKHYPEIKALTAVPGQELEPLSKMTDWRWKETMLKLCDMIDEYFKPSERPKINLSVKGKSFPRISNVQLLAAPSHRRIEVLVFARDKRWWRQSVIEPGKTTTKINLGDATTPSGARYKVVAMTVDGKLTKQTYLNLPNHRTISEEFTLVRV